MSEPNNKIRKSNLDAADPSRYIASIRFPLSIWNRIRKAAKITGTDPSALTRQAADEKAMKILKNSGM